MSKAKVILSWLTNPKTQQEFYNKIIKMLDLVKSRYHFIYLLHIKYTIFNIRQFIKNVAKKIHQIFSTHLFSDHTEYYLL